MQLCINANSKVRQRPTFFKKWQISINFLRNLHLCRDIHITQRPFPHKVHPETCHEYLEHHFIKLLPFLLFYNDEARAKVIMTNGLRKIMKYDWDHTFLENNTRELFHITYPACSTLCLGGYLSKLCHSSRFPRNSR